MSLFANPIDSQLCYLLISDPSEMSLKGMLKEHRTCPVYISQLLVYPSVFSKWQKKGKLSFSGTHELYVLGNSLTISMPQFPVKYV